MGGKRTFGIGVVEWLETLELLTAGVARKGEVAVRTIMFAVALATLSAPTVVTAQTAAASENRSQITFDFDHIAMHVADIAKSAAFYQRLFGFREIESAVDGIRWLDTGRGVQLHLVPGRTAPVPDVLAVHMAFRTSDMARTLAILDEQQIAWGDSQKTRGVISTSRRDGVRQIYFRDPDGYGIEVNDVRTSKKD